MYLNYSSSVHGLSSLSMRWSEAVTKLKVYSSLLYMLVPILVLCYQRLQSSNHFHLAPYSLGCGASFDSSDILA